MAKNSDGQLELVLENRQLLLIFLGMVALWGVFFSLGYIVGRNTGSADAAMPTESTVTASSDKPNPMPPAAYLSRPEDISPATEDQQTPATELNFDQSTSEPLPEARLAVAQAPATASPEAAPETIRPVAASPAPAGILVQVSALTRQEDAQSLVRLLKERNLPVLVTSGATDSLYHVVVGPYQTESEAQQTKKLLEGDGFQPIIKR